MIPLLASCQNETKEEVFLGKSDATHEMILVFDYSCPYCHQWIDEVFPVIEENFIDSGQAKFKTQALAFVNEQSKELAKLDQNLKRYEPESYFEIFLSIMDQNGQVSLEDLQLNEELLLQEPLKDVDVVTIDFAEKHDIQYVPSVLVNGEKVEDPFDLKEISSLLK